MRLSCKRVSARAGTRGASAALAATALAAGIAPAPAPAAVRDVWVAAVPRPTWNLMPNGRDAVTGEEFAPSASVVPTVA